MSDISAIIESGSKQYRIKQGDIIDVELLPESENQPVEFKNILFVQNDSQMVVGAPYVNNCTVKGTLLSEVKGPKVITYKYKKRKNCRKKTGHRQKYARVQITEIKMD
jgi:large subunit ribosomal protein L21